MNVIALKCPACGTVGQRLLVDRQKSVWRCNEQDCYIFHFQVDVSVEALGVTTQ